MRSQPHWQLPKMAARKEGKKWELPQLRGGGEELKREFLLWRNREHVKFPRKHSAFSAPKGSRGCLVTHTWRPQKKVLFCGGDSLSKEFLFFKMSSPPPDSSRDNAQGNEATVGQLELLTWHRFPSAIQNSPKHESSDGTFEPPWALLGRERSRRNKSNK